MIARKEHPLPKAAGEGQALRLSRASYTQDSVATSKKGSASSGFHPRYRQWENQWGKTAYIHPDGHRPKKVAGVWFKALPPNQGRKGENKRRREQDRRDSDTKTSTSVDPEAHRRVRKHALQ
jgi:hypothetical protein